MGDSTDRGIATNQTILLLGHDNCVDPITHNFYKTSISVYMNEAVYMFIEGSVVYVNIIITGVFKLTAGIPLL
ncbi:MAG: hypothetical protein JWP29_5645 [Rhodoferax sp.]|nr:hypothetical protein [Rhodoferax sp.]